MFTFLVIVIIIVCILLSLAVLIQNPKGSGLGAGFANIGNQVMGARRATETIEKATWTLAITLLALTLLSAMFLPTDSVPMGGEEKGAAAKTLEDRPLAPQGFDNAPTIGTPPAGGGQEEMAPASEPAGDGE